MVPDPGEDDRDVEQVGIDDVDSQDHVNVNGQERDSNYRRAQDDLVIPPVFVLIGMPGTGHRFHSFS